MLSKVTLANAAGEDIVLHEDTTASKRFIVDAQGTLGTGALRQTVRVRPQAHGAIVETKYEEGRRIVINGEVWSHTSIEDALAEFRKITQVALETLDSGAALLKWTEGASGNKLQMLVKLDSDLEPILKEAAAYIQYHMQLVAEDPRAYSQTLTTETGATITGGTSKAELEEAEKFIKTETLKPGLAIDGTYIYFAGKEAIGRAKLNGTGVEPTWIKTGGGTPTDIAVNASNIFWTSSLGIGRATIAGATIEKEWLKHSVLTLAEASIIEAIAIDGTYIYYGMSRAHIGRVKLGGTGVEQEWLNPLAPVFALAVNASYIYYSLGATIGRATIAGAELNNNFITGTSGTRGIALDATYIYWTNETGNTIGRAKLAGTEATQAFISGLSGPARVAANAEHFYWNNTTPGYISRSINIAGGPSGGAVTIAQAGNRPTPLTFKVHGPMENPSIVRESDGARITLTGAIAEGNYIEVNTAERTVKLNGTSNAYNMLNAQNTDWSAFAPLASTKYLLTGSSATAAYMEVLYRSAYA